MKKLAYDLAAFVFGSPVIVTGQGLQVVGTAGATAFVAVHQAGVVTEAKGRSVKGGLQAKAAEAEAEAAVREHEAAKARMLRVIAGLTAACEKQKRKNEELEAALKAAEVEYATLIARGVSTPATTKKASSGKAATTKKASSGKAATIDSPAELVEA